MVSATLVKKFKEAVKQDFGKDLTVAEADQILNGLVGYFDLLARLRHRITDQSHGSKKSN